VLASRKLFYDARKQKLIRPCGIGMYNKGSLMLKKSKLSSGIAVVLLLALTFRRNENLNLGDF
jgi:hypothetical protein